MEKLSIEEKAKRFDEALERAKNFIENGDEREGTIAESIFAGLMEESEDERIRKDIVFYIAANHKDDGEKARWLYWLENQGEKEKFIKKELGCIRGYREEAIRRLHELGKQGEQKPAEEYNITGIGSKNAQGKLGEMIKNLKPVNEVLEHDSAWSEENKQIIKNIQNDYHNRLGAGIITKAYHDKVISFLKSLSFKNKWNDVSVPPKFPCDILFKYPNGNMFIYRYLENGKRNDPETPMFRSLEEGEWIYLDNISPQSHWKPSKEQLNGLKETIEFLGCTKTRREQLQSLYEQLMKLRREE